MRHAVFTRWENKKLPRCWQKRQRLRKRATSKNTKPATTSTAHTRILSGWDSATIVFNAGTFSNNPQFISMYLALPGHAPGSRVIPIRTQILYPAYNCPAYSHLFSSSVNAKLFLGGPMIRHFVALPFLALLASFTYAQPSLPSSFQAKTVHSPEGADIFVRWGGTGPAVVLIHGYAENSDSWAPLAADLMKDRTVRSEERRVGKEC